jgi:hypothetical protein
MDVELGLDQHDSPGLQVSRDQLLKTTISTKSVYAYPAPVNNPTKGQQYLPIQKLSLLRTGSRESVLFIAPSRYRSPGLQE